MDLSSVVCKIAVVFALGMLPGSASAQTPTPTSKPANLAAVPVLSADEADAIERVANQHGVDGSALKSLITRSRASKSDSLVVLKDGATIWEEFSESPHAKGPIEAMSATKSIVTLAFGRLLYDGRLDTLDAPVHRFYPEWNQGQKAKVTIRHLLTQRSGLHSERITTEIYRSPDFVQLALCADLVEEPGATWRYNNSGTNLLAGIVQKISGKRMDVLLGEEVFAPLGITEWKWSLDKSGNPHGMSGLQIRAVDLAKIGQLMLDGGVCGPEIMGPRRRILSEEFVREATTHYEPLDPTRFEGTWAESVAKRGQALIQDYGLLWWPKVQIDQAVTERLLGEWRRAGADEAFVKKMEKAKGLHIGDNALWVFIRDEIGGEKPWMENTLFKDLPDFDTLARPQFGYAAEGYLGQYLLVIPEHRVVAVRQRISPQTGYDEEKRLDSFDDFDDLVAKMVRISIAMPSP